METVLCKAIDSLFTCILYAQLKGNGPRKPAKPEMEPNFYRLSILPTYEMARRDAYHNLRFASCPSAAKPRGDLEGGHTIRAHRAGVDRQTLGPCIALPFLMPKPPENSYSHGECNTGAVISPPTDPSGIEGFMMSVHATSLNDTTPPQAVPTSNVVIPHNTSALTKQLSSSDKNVQLHAAVLPYGSNPTTRHGASLTMTDSKRVPVYAACQGGFNAAHGSLSLEDSKQQRVLCTATSFGMQHHVPAANQLAASSDFPMVCDDVSDAALTMMVTALEGTDIQDEDDDFAHILFDLADGQTL